ncbi:MAG: TatD family hydrolase [Actinomycetes bacterium]|jgi:TatD DNase family protein
MSDRFSLDKEREVAPLPEPLTSACIDNHAHLELITESEPDSPLIKAILDEAQNVGIDRVIQVGYSATQSAWGVACAESFPGRVLAAVALHPNEAPVTPDLEGDLLKISILAEHPRVRAIGETGLDFFRTAPEGREKQLYSFKRHIQIAKDVNKAVMIHDRDAHREVLDTLEEVGAPEKVVFHCFSGDAQMALECVAKGYYLSFAGTVTFKNAPHLREALALTPMNQILVETDSPFLTPMPNRGLLNTPAQIPNTLRQMADVKQVDIDLLCQAIVQNTIRVYGEFN